MIANLEELNKTLIDIANNEQDYHKSSRILRIELWLEQTVKSLKTEFEL